MQVDKNKTKIDYRIKQFTEKEKQSGYGKM